MTWLVNHILLFFYVRCRSKCNEMSQNLLLWGICLPLVNRNFATNITCIIHIAQLCTRMNNNGWGSGSPLCICFSLRTTILWTQSECPGGLLHIGRLPFSPEYKLHVTMNGRSGSGDKKNKEGCWPWRVCSHIHSLNGGWGTKNNRGHCVLGLAANIHIQIWLIASVFSSH